jgi:hypothetical protein
MKIIQHCEFSRNHIEAFSVKSAALEKENNFQTSISRYSSPTPGR